MEETLMRKIHGSVERKIVLAVVAGGMLVAAALAGAALKAPGVAASFAAEKGKFKILLEGRTVGHEEFEIAPSGAGWVAKGSTDFKTSDGPPIHVTGTLALQADGAPVSYDWSAKTDKTNGAHIIFVNGVAKITLEREGARPFEQDLTFNSPMVAVLDNNLYHQYAVLAHIYDWSKRGAQTFPVLIPQDRTPGSIIVEATGPLSAEGKSYEGLRVTTSDLEVVLYLDAKHQMQRLEVPAAKVSVVREY
jgi:hypothetical protein